jgi:hypothetical protein
LEVEVKKYVIWMAVLLAAYGVAMGVMWSRYEPRDKHIEFQSDFRDGLVGLLPAITFEEVPTGNLREALYIYTADPRILDTLVDILDKEEPVILTNAGVVSRDGRLQILVKYMTPAPIIFQNGSQYDGVIMTRLAHYDWPGDPSSWTATNLRYDGGDFHYDNKGDMWLWTWFSLLPTFMAWAIGLLVIAGAKKKPRETKRSK